MFEAPEQFTVPNFVLQAILADSKEIYIEKLEKLTDKSLSDA